MSEQTSAFQSRRLGWILGGLLLAAVLTSAPIWLKFAWPVLSLQKLAAHGQHYGTLFAHAVGGSFMLLAGGLALYVGWTRRWARWHRWFGYSYLIGGGLGSVMALVLSARLSHPPISVGVATGTLAAVWLVFGAMAWRAARNRRFDSHREWMVRSYVLTWTFVGCRIAQMVPPFPHLGEQGVTAGVWLYWVVPMVICEIALQWSRGGRLAARS